MGGKGTIRKNGRISERFKPLLPQRRFTPVVFPFAFFVKLNQIGKGRQQFHPAEIGNGPPVVADSREIRWGLIDVVGFIQIESAFFKNPLWIFRRVLGLLPGFWTGPQCGRGIIIKRSSIRHIIDFYLSKIRHFCQELCPSIANC